MNAIPIDGYPFLRELTPEEQDAFHALEEGEAVRVIQVGKRGGDIAAIRAQLTALSTGTPPPALPPTDEELDLPAADPRSPRHAEWCATQPAGTPGCRPGLPDDAPTDPEKLARWCNDQTPRPEGCPPVGATPGVTSTEYPITDPRNPGYAAYCGTNPPPPGCNTLATTGDGTVATTGGAAKSEEGLVQRVMKNPPWWLFAGAGAVVGWWAAGKFAAPKKASSKSDDDEE